MYQLLLDLALIGYLASFSMWVNWNYVTEVEIQIWQGENAA